MIELPRKNKQTKSSECFIRFCCLSMGVLKTRISKMKTKKENKEECKG